MSFWLPDKRICMGARILAEKEGEAGMRRGHLRPNAEANEKAAIT